MSKRKEVSEVWTHFKILEETPHLAQCSLCSTKISRGKINGPKKSFSVKGMWDHLNARHKEAYKTAKASQEELVSKKKKENDDALAARKSLYQLNAVPQPSLEQCLERSSKWSADSPNQKQAERRLLNWIFDDLQPYTVVDNNQFKSMIGFLNRKFDIPSEKVVRTTLMPKLYREVQKELFESLSIALKEGHYSVTCDVWSSLALYSYLGLTVHFITEDFVRKILVLRCLPYNESHTGESIKGRVVFVLEKWGLSVDRLHCIVSDTAANMRRAFTDMDWISCFLHVLAIVVKHSIFEQSGVKLVVNKVKKMIIKLRTPAGRWKCNKLLYALLIVTATLQKYLNKILGNLKFPNFSIHTVNLCDVCTLHNKFFSRPKPFTGKRIRNENQTKPTALITPCDTRWNSWYSMMDCATMNKTAITIAQQDLALQITARLQVNYQISKS